MLCCSSPQLTFLLGCWLQPRTSHVFSSCCLHSFASLWWPPRSFSYPAEWLSIFSTALQQTFSHCALGYTFLPWSSLLWRKHALKCYGWWAIKESKWKCVAVCSSIPTIRFTEKMDLKWDLQYSEDLSKRWKRPLDQPCNMSKSTWLRTTWLWLLCKEGWTGIWTVQAV